MSGKTGSKISILLQGISPLGTLNVAIMRTNSSVSSRGSVRPEPRRRNRPHQFETIRSRFAESRRVVQATYPSLQAFPCSLVRRLRNEERLARHEQYGCYQDQAAADAVKLSSASSSRFPVNIDRPIATRERNSSTSAPSSSLTVSITVSPPDCRFSKRLQKPVRVAARAPACEWTLFKANPSTTPGSHNRPIADRMRALRWKYAVEDRPRAARDRPGTEAAIGAMRSSRGMI